MVYILWYSLISNHQSDVENTFLSSHCLICRSCPHENTSERMMRFQNCLNSQMETVLFRIIRHKALDQSLGKLELMDMSFAS